MGLDEHDHLTWSMPTLLAEPAVSPVSGKYRSAAWPFHRTTFSCPTGQRGGNRGSCKRRIRYEGVARRHESTISSAGLMGADWPACWPTAIHGSEGELRLVMLPASKHEEESGHRHRNATAFAVLKEKRGLAVQRCVAAKGRLCCCGAACCDSHAVADLNSCQH